MLENTPARKSGVCEDANDDCYEWATEAIRHGSGGIKRMWQTLCKEENLFSQLWHY